MTAQQPTTTGNAPVPPGAAPIIAAQQPPQAQQPQQVPPTIVIGGYPAPDPATTPGTPPGYGEQQTTPPGEGEGREPEVAGQGILGTRYTATLTNRGKKFVSNSTDDGVTVKVTRAEARVLLAEKHISATAPSGPQLGGMSPSQGEDGTLLTITGFGFQPLGANSKVTVGGVTATPVSWSADTVVVRAVKGASAVDTALPVVLTPQVGGTLACGNFTFRAAYTVGAVAPATGPNGQAVTIAGTGLGSNTGQAAVLVGPTNGGVLATVTGWTTTSISATLNRGTQPTGIPILVSVRKSDGTVKQASNGFTFTS